MKIVNYKNGWVAFEKNEKEYTAVKIDDNVIIIEECGVIEEAGVGCKKQSVIVDFNILKILIKEAEKENG